jgi:hypothetical protein
MNIRALTPADVNEIKRIHKQYPEFELPDFLTNYYGAFVVESEGRVITCGGVHPIAESVILTDKTTDIDERRQALYQVLQASAFIARNKGFDQLHASIINDEKWKRHLLKVGFRPTKGDVLVIGV